MERRRLVPSATRAFLDAAASKEARNRWIELAVTNIWPDNLVAHARIRTDIPRKTLIGAKLCAYNPQRMMNASIRIRVWGGSTCVLLLFENGSINVDGTHSMEETIRAIHAAREMILRSGGTFAEISDMQLTNGVYNISIDSALPLEPVHELNQDIVDADRQFPGVRLRDKATGIKTRIFPAGPNGRMNTVQMGVRDPAMVAVQNELNRRLIYDTYAAMAATSAAVRAAMEAAPLQNQPGVASAAVAVPAISPLPSYPSGCKF
jgi:TATA-box binding protein (TBP) (component of TFIID and TFIIIB)